MNNAGMPEHVIEAICDDPRHARGKVAKVATFGRFTLPNGEVRWKIWDGDRWSYTVRPRETHRGRVEVHHRYDAEPEKGSRYRWPCKLCPRSFEVREDTLQQVLEAIYRGQLAAATPGAPVSIKALRGVASKLAAEQ